MTLDNIIAFIFTSFYILVLVFFILRALSLMKRENKYKEALKINKQNTRKWGLVVLEPGANRTLRRNDFIQLRNGLTIGRNETNTIILTDPYISNEHTRFFIHNGRFVIEDLNSKNGTMLNKDRLLKKTFLRNDDIVTIGTTIFRVISR